MNTRRLAKAGEIVVVLALVAGTGYLGKLLHHNYVVHAPKVSEVRKAPGVIPARDAAGARATLAVKGSERQLLFLVLRTTCPFCEENMPNWDRLAGDLAPLGAEAPEIVVLSLSPAAETRAYLQRHRLDLPVRYVDRSVLPLLGLVGVPATVAVDPETLSLSVWDGVLGDPEREAILAWSGALSATPIATGAGGR